jgi:hypothetical protein
LKIIELKGSKWAIYAIAMQQIKTNYPRRGHCVKEQPGHQAANACLSQGIAILAEKLLQGRVFLEISGAKRRETSGLSWFIHQQLGFSIGLTVEIVFNCPNCL